MSKWIWSFKSLQTTPIQRGREREKKTRCHQSTKNLKQKSNHKNWHKFDVTTLFLSLTKHLHARHNESRQPYVIPCKASMVGSPPSHWFGMDKSTSQTPCPPFHLAFPSERRSDGQLHELSHPDASELAPRRSFLLPCYLGEFTM